MKNGFVLMAKLEPVWTLLIDGKGFISCHNWLRFAPFSIMARRGIFIRLGCDVPIVEFQRSKV